MKSITTLISSIGLTLALAIPASSLAQNDKNSLPEIGSAGSSILSIDKEKQIGDIMMRQLRSQQPLLHDPVLTEYVHTLGNKMVINANDVNFPFKFFLINQKEINAFAFFGGHIGIHTGLITSADTESEFASVIAHEISHVTQRHLARRLEAQSKSQPLTMAGMVSGVLLALVNPTVGMAALSTTMAASQQAGINYTRGNEQEADRVGMVLLANSGFDPHGSPSFFAKLAEQYRYKSKPPAMLLTHPLPDSRIADARARAQQYPVRQLAPGLNFELSKARIIARYENDAEFNITQYKDILKKKKYQLEVAAQYGLANAYFENKDYQEALDIVEPLFESDDKNLFYADLLSDLYIYTKQFDKAIAMLDRLNKLMPHHQVVALNYANVLQEAGEYSKSENLLKDFLAVKSDHFLANDLMTTVYKKQKKKALQHVSQAEVYALLGGFQRAVDELQTAYTHADDQPLIQKRIKARILQFQEQEEKIRRLSI